MIRHPLLRVVVALFLGGAAGVSLCISILPMVLQLRGAGDTAGLAFYLGRYFVWSGVLWALAALAVTRVGHLQAAGIVMASVGVVSGVGLVALALAPIHEYLVAGGITGLIYGYLGGLIFGRLFVPSGPWEDDL